MRYENLICPTCSAPLSISGGSLYCDGAKKHCFDVARSGYVNLLPPGKKSNSTAGDDDVMLRARRDFLGRGFYDKISDSVADAIKKYHHGTVSTFLDAGCGEGYHTIRIFDALGCKGAIGIDASKHGADKAAKKAGDKGLCFIAGNIFNMPIKEKSQDAVVSMFAPVPDSEAERILSDDGVLVVCSSGEEHLLELRQVIYDEVRISPVLSRVPDGFELCGVEELEYRVSLEKEDVDNLFKMTPFYYRTPKSGKERLASLDGLTVTVQIQNSIYKKSEKRN